MIKKTFAVLLSLALALTLFGCGGIDINISTDTYISTADDDTSTSKADESETSAGGQNSSEAEESEVFEGAVAGDKIVFLGDSIAQGYGLENIEAERYSSLLAEKYGCQVYNYAVAGDDGADLIALLDSGKCTELKNATAVVLSIGANNVLKAAESLYPVFDKLQKGESVDPESIEVSPIFKEVSDGAERFKTELPEIIKRIKQSAPNAQIIFQTVYNPYKDFTNITVKMGVFDVTFAAFSASSVKLINDVITEGASTHGYTLADVYGAFEQTVSVRLVNAVNDGSNFDPHPNRAGHEAIAETVNGVIK